MFLYSNWTHVSLDETCVSLMGGWHIYPMLLSLCKSLDIGPIL